MLVVGKGLAQENDTHNQPVSDTLTLKDETTLIAVPYVSYSPETEALLGAAGILSFYIDSSTVEHRRAATITAGASISSLGQIMVATNFDLYFNEMKSRVNGRIGHEQSPARFYGIGPYSEQADEVWFNPEYNKVAVSYYHRIIETEEGQGFTVGGRFEYWNTVMRPYEQEQTIPEDFVEPIGWNGGLALGLGVGATYDTRDNAYFPTRNVYVELRSMTYPKAFGADFGYNRSWLDIRGFTHVMINKEPLVFAGQIVFDKTIGDAPFYDKPTYGGDMYMRGILRGRYIDQTSMVIQAEARTLIFWKLGLSAFIAAGDIYSGTLKMSLGHTKIAGGAGLRVYIDREAGVIGRVDLGFSEWGSAVYLTFGEAF